MKEFQANKSYYSESHKSYTSNDEFNLAKRVQITNEMPPQDMFDMAHSLIKNDLWKWFFGSSFLSYGVKYNEDTDGVETIGDDSYIKDESIAKYVNGIRAKDYGPKPALKWNPDYKRDYKKYVSETGDTSLKEDDFKYKTDYSKEYHRIEIDGALLPEVDLLLHEIYRYLGVLYPDHPDFSKLLTDNELNDEIAQAGSIIDYVPDFQYFEWLSKRLDYSRLDQSYTEEYALNEATKLKIRNLLSYATNRKFAGSKAGIKMLGADVFQHISVFPAAEYLPYKPLEINENKTYNTSNNLKWLMRFYKQPDSLDADGIDRSHVLYKKLFRLIDWTNSTYDLLNRWREPAKFYGTAYPTPYSRFDLYEYPLQRVLDGKDVANGWTVESLSRTIANDFKSGQKIKLNGQNDNWETCQKAHIAYIDKEPRYSVSYRKSDGKTFNVSTIENDLTHIAVDTSVQPVYTQMTVFPSVKTLLSKIVEHDNLKSVVENDENPDIDSKLRFRISWTDKDGKQHSRDYLKSYVGKTSLRDSYSAFYKAFYGIKDGSFKDEDYTFKSSILSGLRSTKIPYRLPIQAGFTLDPSQNGCMYIAPQHMMTTFADTLDISVDLSEWSDKDNTDPQTHIVYKPTQMSEDGSIQKGDILSYDDTNGRSFVSAVLGISNAYLQFSLKGSPASYDEITEAVNEANDTASGGISKYGLVFKLSDNNQYAGGKKVVVFGTPHFEDATESKGKYISKSVYFDIKAIPRAKTHIQLLEIYGSDFKTACENKYQALTTLIEDGVNGTDYNTWKKEIDAFNKAYAKASSSLTDLMRALDGGILHYNDKYWNSVKKNGQALVECFSCRPVLERKLDEAFTAWIDKYDVMSSKLAPADEIRSTAEEMLAKFTAAYGEMRSWLVEEIAIIIDNSKNYKLINYSTKDFTMKSAIETLQKCDNILFTSMMPNRAFLLSPAPSDLLMQDLDEVSKMSMSYSLLSGQDKFDHIIVAGLNDVKDQLRWHKADIFGSSGLLINCLSYNANAWSFGSLNTASLVESHFKDGSYITSDVSKGTSLQPSFLDNYYGHSKDYIEKTSVADENGEKFGVSSTVELFTLNEDLQSDYDNDTEQHKFSYADPNFLEVFLQDWMKNNMQGEALTYNTVKINAHFVEGSNVITFEEEAAIEAMQYISTGDQVIGKSVSDDTFIEAIDYDSHTITVSNEMYVTDEAVLTFLCRVQFEPDDTSEDFYSYRVRASKSKNAETGSVFAHNVQSDFSQYMLTPPIDIEEYRDGLLTALQEQDELKQNFNDIVSKAYLGDLDKNVYYVRPATPSCEGNMMIDVNAYTIFDSEYIMSQKTLDYISEYLDDLTRSSDNISLGVSINGYTTSSGEVSVDSNIGSTFQVTSAWAKGSVPAYVKIGTGKLLIEDDERNDEEEHSYSGAVYGDAVYSTDPYYASESSNEANNNVSKFKYTDIDKPLFKSYIGEYETYKDIELDGGKYTAIQFTMMKRAVDSLKIKREAPIFSKHTLDEDPLATFNQDYIYDDNGIQIVDRTKTFVYEKGKRAPTVSNSLTVYYSVDSNGDFIFTESNGKQTVKVPCFAGFIGVSETTGTASFTNSFDSSCHLQEAIRKHIETMSGKSADSFSGKAFVFSYVYETGGAKRAAKNVSKIPSKTYICAVYVNGSLEICEFKKCVALTKVKLDKSLFATSQAKSLYEIVSKGTDENILPSECLEDYTTKIELNKHTDIVEGTFKSDILLKLGYTADAFKYSADDEITTESKTIDLTYNYLHPDEANKTFYTYDENGDKYALQMKSNKYFKNVINNIVQYKTYEELNSSSVVTKGEIVPVDGFDFDASSMTLQDRVLSIDKVNLRSDYNASLEPTFISKYSTVRGYLKSYNPDTKEITISYALQAGPKSSSAISSFAYELEKLKPATESGDEYSESSLIFDESKFSGNIIQSPTVIGVKTFDENDVSHSLAYFKNRLIAVGYIDASDTSTITFKHPKALKSLNLLQINDYLAEVALLDNTSSSFIRNNGKVSNLKYIGYKNNIFYEFYENAIYASYCSSWNGVSSAREKAAVLPISGKLESVAWDDDIDKYIYTATNGANGNGGIFFVEATIDNGEISLSGASENAYVNSSSTALDIDTNQLIKIVDKRAETAGLEYNGKDSDSDKEVLARDIAFAGIDESCYGDNNDIVATVAGKDEILSARKVLNVASFSKECFDDVKFNRLTMKISPMKDDEDNAQPASVKLSGDIKTVYIYNYNTDKFETASVSDNLFLFKNLSNANGSQDGNGPTVEVIIDVSISDEPSSLVENGLTYLVDTYEDVGNAQDGYDGHYLWNLSRSFSSNAIYAVAVLSNSNGSISLTCDKGLAKLDSASVEKPKVIDSTNISTIGKYRNFFYAQDTGAKVLVSSNSSGDMAALNGNTIFIKHEKQTYNASGTNRSTLTAKKYWTRATLPRMQDLSFNYLNDLDTEELYDLVNEHLERVNSYYKTQDESSLSDCEKAKKTFLESYTLITPKEFIDEFDQTDPSFKYKNGIIVKGLKYETTLDGRTPIFDPRCNGSKIQTQYVVPMSTTIENGVTATAYLVRQTYVNYLRDFYEIALGCNRLVDITDGKNIRSFRVTDSDVEIITTNDDILLFPLSKATSRSFIESPSNWICKSINPSLEYTSYSDGGDTLHKLFIGYIDNNGNERWETSYTTATCKIKKLYSISSWADYESMRFFFGKVDVSSIDRDTLEDFDYKTNGAFVAYSSDNGSTYTFSYYAGESDGLKGCYFASSTQVNAILSSSSYYKATISSTALTGLEKVTPSVNTESQDNDPWKDGGEWSCTGFLGSNEYVVFNDAFYIKSVRANSFTGSITSISQDSIVIQYDNSNADTTLNDGNGSVRALLSFKTTASVADPTLYIDNIQDIYNSFGLLKVAKVDKVDNLADANLAYSYNECISAGETDSPRYYPSVKKDLNGGRNVYDYDSAVKEDGSVVYTQVDATNSSDEPVYLYDSTNGSIVFERQGPDYMRATLEDIVKTGASISDAARMAKVKDGYEFIYNDGSYGDVSKARLERVDFESKTITIKSDEMAAVLDNNIASNEYYYIWPSKLVETNGDIAADDLMNGNPATYNKIASSSTDAFEMKLQSIISVRGDLSHDDLADMFGTVKVGNGIFAVSGTDGQRLLNEKVIYLTLSMTYLAKSSKFTSFKNASFALSDESHIADYSDGTPINSVFIDPVGYGGVVGNTSFVDTLPWELDKAAFTSKTMRNSNDELVYLSDESGSNLTVKKGNYELKKSSRVSFSWSMLANDYLNEVHIGDKVLNVYKIPDTLAKIYTPTDKIAERTVLRVYKDNRLENSSVGDGERYTLSVKNLADEDVPFSFDGSTLTVPESGKGDTFVVSVYDSLSGQTSTKTLYRDNDTPFVDVEPIYLPLSGDAAAVSYNIKANASCSLSSTNSNTIVVDKQSKQLNVSKDILETDKLVATVSGKTYQIDLDLHFRDVKTYKDGNGRSVSFDGCEIIGSYSNVGSYSWPLEIADADDAHRDIGSCNFVMTIGSPDFSLIYTGEESIMAVGAPGPVAMKMPAKSSFKDLIASFGRVITKEDGRIYTYGKNELLSFSKIDYTYVVLDKLAIDGKMLSDEIASTDFLKIRALPLSSVLVDTKYMNNEDYYAEVDVRDLDFYSYDRVYVDTSVSLPAPVNINGVIYNSSSFSQYTTDLWENKDNVPVYLCDESGHFYMQDKSYISSLKMVRLDRDTGFSGDCSLAKYQSVDSRLQPYKTLYETAYSSFYDRFYSPDELCNPFVKHLSVRDCMVDGKWERKSSVYVREKINGKMSNVEDGTISVLQCYYKPKAELKTVESKTVDYKNGMLRLCLVGPQNEQSKTMSLCGITYSNAFSSESYVDDGKLAIGEAVSVSSFSTASVEDPANSEKSNIVDITEMGVFDNDDNLIAYMTHPIAQYDTSKNHISYNLLIQE